MRKSSHFRSGEELKESLNFLFEWRVVSGGCVMTLSSHRWPLASHQSLLPDTHDRHRIIQWTILFMDARSLLLDVCVSRFSNSYRRWYSEEAARGRSDHRKGFQECCFELAIISDSPSLSLLGECTGITVKVNWKFVSFYGDWYCFICHLP